MFILSSLSKKYIKSLGQAFSKACGFLGQRPKSASAEAEIPLFKAIFARVWGRFFKKKSPPRVNSLHNINLEKGASGTFFDGLNRQINFVGFHIFRCLFTNVFTVKSFTFKDETKFS